MTFIEESERPTISIVTPCRNAGSRLRRTIDSVLAQSAIRSGRARLEYVIVDGASDDDTAAVIEEFRDPRIHVISEPDSGMYDALSKGLARLSGDLHAYINAGDLYHPAAFDVALDVAAQGVRWMVGSAFYYNDRGQVVGFRLPYRYRRGAIRRGLYGTVLPAVQQESCFWSGDLTARIDLDRLRDYRLAGDHYIWWTFAESEDLYIVASFLGGFTYHGDHLSDDGEGYRSEIERHALPRRPFDRPMALLERQLWRSPDRIKKMLNAQHLLCFDRKSSAWR